jgi:hypothetical protein
MRRKCLRGLVQGPVAAVFCTVMKVPVSYEVGNFLITRVINSQDGLRLQG